MRRCPRLGAPAARPPGPARAYLQRRRSRKSGAATHTCKSRPGGGEATPRHPPAAGPPAPMCAGLPPAPCAPRASRARPPGCRPGRLPCATPRSPRAPAGSRVRSCSCSDSPNRLADQPSLGGPAIRGLPALGAPQAEPSELLSTHLPSGR